MRMHFAFSVWPHQTSAGGTRTLLVTEAAGVKVAIVAECQTQNSCFCEARILALSLGRALPECHLVLTVSPRTALRSVDHRASMAAHGNG